MTTPSSTMQRPAPANLPPLSPAAQAHSDATAAHLRKTISANGGWLPFDHWMAEALYAPGLGYYAAGNVKLADADDGAKTPAGDFVTAPQLTPLFARTIARQAAEVLRQTQTQAVLEFGAGTGALAEGVLRELDALGLDQTQYLILEVSADLRARQAERLAPFGSRVQWLDALPNAFAGCVLANEVLDAMPVSLFCWSEDGAVRPHWRRPWPRACRRCPATCPKSMCKAKPGSPPWAVGWNAAPRYWWIMAFRAASSTIRNARAARSCAICAITRMGIPSPRRGCRTSPRTWISRPWRMRR
jgi:hypothetical protein